ncbi:hypothetical protein SDC9_166736 [bioreactor metagenome]|uniref:Uncharacterized protein n=1 Tax=bioreactor metagenome TaxID=1076179 RepID=A0A645FXV4_9ZZZZ
MGVKLIGGIVFPPVRGIVIVPESPITVPLTMVPTGKFPNMIFLCSLPSVSAKLFVSSAARSREESSSIVAECETSEPLIFRSTESVTARTSTSTETVSVAPETPEICVPESFTSYEVAEAVTVKLVPLSTGGRTCSASYCAVVSVRVPVAPLTW